MAFIPRLTHDPAQFPIRAGERLQYDLSQLFDLLGSNGFHGNGLDIGAAVIQAESGGNAHARHINADGSIDRGIFQINNKAHPDVSDACAYDPRCATRAASRISKGGTDWSPWSTFVNGDYKKFYKGAGSTSKASGATNAGLPDKLPNPVAQFFDLITSLQFWLRIGEGIAGLVLIAMGLKALTGVTVPIPTPAGPVRV